MTEIAIQRTTNHQIPQAVQNLLVNDDLTNNIKREIKFLDPICQLVNVCQDPATSLSEGASLWINLKTPPPLQEPPLEIDLENETEVEEDGLIENATTSIPTVAVAANAGLIENPTTTIPTVAVAANADNEAGTTDGVGSTATPASQPSLNARDIAFFKRNKMALTPYALDAYFLDPIYSNALKKAVDVDGVANDTAKLDSFQKLAVRFLYAA